MAIKYVVGSTVQWDIERGDQEIFYVTWQTDGVAVDLTGYDAELLNSDGEAIDAVVTIPAPTNGQVKIQFNPSLTEDLVDQYYRLRVSSGSAVKTLLEGRINVT